MLTVQSTKWLRNHLAAKPLPTTVFGAVDSWQYLPQTTDMFW